MDEKRFSLRDIFALLRESTELLNDNVAVITDDARIRMCMSDFVAMSVGYELTSEQSRLAGETPLATKEEVIEAMKQNYFSEKAYPVYDGFGVQFLR